MKALILCLFFMGVIAMLHGIYEQKYEGLRDNTRVEYRFLPRSYYDEQLGDTPGVSGAFKNMFQRESPWFERSVSLANPLKDVGAPGAR